MSDKSRQLIVVIKLYATSDETRRDRLVTGPPTLARHDAVPPRAGCCRQTNGGGGGRRVRYLAVRAVVVVGIEGGVTAVARREAR